MKTRTADLFCLVLVVLTAGVAITLYSELPDPVPTHWNAAGDVDGYTAKPWGVVIMPIMAVAIWILMKVIPRISPKGYGTEDFQGVVNLFQLMIVGFMCAIGVLTLLAAAGYGVRVDLVVPIGVGLLFVALGNYFTKVRKNFFIGIRTPWTLASDEVWARTHRLGGRIFMLTGLLMVGSAFVGGLGLAMVGIVFGLVLIPVVYSYILYRRLEGFEGGDDNGTNGDLAA